MPRSAMESVRQQLESMRRQRNVRLVLTFAAGWLLAVSILSILLVAAGLVFDFGNTAWQVASSLWLGGVFVLSFFCFWRAHVRWESRQHFAHRVEQALPGLEQRLITSLEFDPQAHSPGVSRQLIHKLSLDAKQRIRQQRWDSFTSFTALRGIFIATGAALFAVAALLQFSSDFLRGTQQLTWAWADSPLIDEQRPLISIRVEPGHAALQRGDDMRIVATLENTQAAGLVLYVQEDQLNWKKLNMGPEQGEAEGNASVFVADLRQLDQDLVYYVEYSGSEAQGKLRSPQYQVTLFDLPRVDNIALTYTFPDYTQLESREENPGGDILAPEGSHIVLSAELNMDVQEAHVVFDNGLRLPMTLQDRQASASFDVNENAVYHIELLDHRARQNKNPQEYYLRVIEDRAPNISLRTPGRDQRVMPLEEVVFEVKADDDYGLSEFQLIYNVVGGQEQRVDFLADTKTLVKNKAENLKTINGQTLLYLEDIGAQPGDIISYSVAVKDNNAIRGSTEVVSDIYFLEVASTHHEFSRGRSGGSSGGGGGNSSALVSTQKDVIAATWKLRNTQKQTVQNKDDEQRIATDGRIIRDSQAEVAQRAQMSISRLTERGSFAEQNYENAVRALQRAIGEMESALDSLDQLALNDALAAEQRALQAIMQAEAQINRTEVAMGSAGAGGGGGQNGEREELRELFEMELGELENRYQLPQQQAGQQPAQQDETLDKLKELARRQERLVQSQRELARHQERLAEEQRRRQLEQLRREQEELRRELAQLSQSMQQQSAQSGSQQRQGSSPLQQALQQMEEAASSESPSKAAAKSQKALDALRQQAAQQQADTQRSLAQLQEAAKQRSEVLLQQQRQLQRNVERESRSQDLSSRRDEAGYSDVTDNLLKQQQALRQGAEALARDLRDIASTAGDDRQREAREAHDLARALRSIQDKMETSQQIMRRGMLNLSYKLESDIESELAQVQQGIQALGGGRDDAEPNNEQLAQQAGQLRDTLENLQQQLTQNQVPSGEGAENNNPASRADMQQNLQRGRELAQGLTQMAAGGQPWSGSARAIRSQLTQKNLEAFLNQPELLAALLKPLAELERQLRLDSELSDMDSKLFTALEQDVPEHYKSLIENYYRQLSERKAFQ